MSGKTKKEKLHAFYRRPDCFFIGEKKRKYYHTMHCRCIHRIVKRDLVACGRNPENAGFRPCPICKPSPLPPAEASKPVSKTKALQDKLVAVATEHGMEAKIIGSALYVTTVAGEWFFDYNARPILLHHKNNTKRTSPDGVPIEAHYHTQRETFASPIHALEYIHFHETAAARKVFSPRTTQLRLEESEEGPPQLLLSGLPIRPGYTVTALFPDGWHDVILQLGPDRAGRTRWYIATPAYADYSPGGLFVKV